MIRGVLDFDTDLNISLRYLNISLNIFRSKYSNILYLLGYGTGDHDLGSLGMAVQSLDGVLVETHQDAENADLDDDDADGSDKSFDEHEDD